MGMEGGEDMMDHQKTIIINVGMGLWYSRGSERLRGSLIDKGYRGEMSILVDQWPDINFSRECVYNCKPAAFHKVMQRGYRTIIWADSSITAIAPIDSFIDRINQKGYWLGQSGYNCAQVCTDRQLSFFGMSRDEAEKIPDCATGIFGVNLDFDAPRRFIEQWIYAARQGIFNGSRHHGNQSTDKRFLFGRQDQSCASLIAHKNGILLDRFIEFCGFKWDHKIPTTFRCEGM